MTKRQLIEQSHVRNERFLRDLQPIVGLWITVSLFTAEGPHQTASEGASAPQGTWEKSRVTVELLKEMVDRLEALLETWPNAVWIFFPETGHGGRIRLFRAFNSNIYPAYFPEVLQGVPWRVKPVHGHRWCGISQRTRKESHRAFRLWDQFKAGQSIMAIARRESPSKSSRLIRTWKKELMVVHRSLNRACQLIYEQPLPSHRKTRRLLEFSSDTHLALCRQCRSATTLEQMCPQARDFATQDRQYQRERPLSVEIHRSGSQSQEFEL